VVSAVPEDVSRYLEKAVVTTDESPLAEEGLGTIEEDLHEEPANENDRNALGDSAAAGVSGASPPSRGESVE
jgi:hypothetical protein